MTFEDMAFIDFYTFVERIIGPCKPPSKNASIQPMVYFYGLSSRATVSIEKAAELLNLSPNYVKSLRGKALKTAAKNQNQITIASIKQYKSRQARHPQSTKGESIKPTFTVVSGTRSEETHIGQASGS